MVEVGLIAHFVMALGNPTVSASILITGMLVFSGLGALVSERILPFMRVFMPILFVAIAAMLIGYALFLNLALDAIGALPYSARLLFCFAFIAPPAFLMGFPMSTAMTTLGRLGKEHMFIWAWGVNGCFSVIGAAAAPVIATNFGLGAVIEIAGLRLFSGVAGLLRSNIRERAATDGVRAKPRGGRGMKLRPSRAFVAISGLVWALALAGCAGAPHPATETSMPSSYSAPRFSQAGGANVAFAEFKNSAFPYHGSIPDEDDPSKSRPFLNVDDNGRLGHSSHAERRALGGYDLQRSPCAARRLDRLQPQRARRAGRLLPWQQRHARARRGAAAADGSPARASQSQRRAGRAADGGGRAPIPAPAISGGRAPSRNFSTRRTPSSPRSIRRPRAPRSAACR